VTARSIGRAYNKAKKRVDEALIEQADDAAGQRLTATDRVGFSWRWLGDQ
jgi:hypothetical protein